MTRPRRDAFGAGNRVSAAGAPSQEEIARLAFAYWEAGGRREGTAQQDWCRAERELRRLRGLPETGTSNVTV
jgi:hypothetical protein